MNSQYWTEEQARSYDQPGTPMFSAEVLGPTVEFLSDLAGEGRALELAIGTGRVAVPLRQNGVEVHGIELSEPMVDQLRTKASAEQIPVTIGDMSTRRVPGQFSLVYLVFNTIGNLLTQQAQVDCFRNAATHLAPGGHFVIELGIPALRWLPPGAGAVPFEVSDHHVGLDTLDPLTQRLTSHHYVREADGRYRYDSMAQRYIWPSELDLMGRLAGLELVRRVADFTGAPFTSQSTSHVSVWQRPHAGGQSVPRSVQQSVQ